MIPFTSDEKIGYPVPVYSWQNSEIKPSKYATYYDPNLGVNPNNITQQILKRDVPSYTHPPERHNVVSPRFVASGVLMGGVPQVDNPRQSQPQYTPQFYPPTYNNQLYPSTYSSVYNNQFPYMYNPEPKITRDIMRDNGPLAPIVDYPLFQSPLAVTVSNNWYQYDDVNSDPQLRNDVVRFFRDLTLEQLKTVFSDLLNYFVVKGKNVEYNNNTNDSGKDNKDSNDIKKIKIDFIHHNLLSKKFIAMLLERYTEIKYMKWWDLRKNKEFVSNYIYDKLKERIKKHL